MHLLFLDHADAAALATLTVGSPVRTWKITKCIILNKMHNFFKKRYNHADAAAFITLTVGSSRAHPRSCRGRKGHDVADALSTHGSQRKVRTNGPTAVFAAVESVEVDGNVVSVLEAIASARVDVDVVSGRCSSNTRVVAGGIKPCATPGTTATPGPANVMPKYSPNAYLGNDKDERRCVEDIAKRRRRNVEKTESILALQD
jgi:hypothetical protein